MIYIDDAGSGSLIGGTGIGILRPESNEYVFRVIPIMFFQQPYFSEKKYQQYATKIVAEAFKKLDVTTKEPVYVCQGYIFDDLRTWLDDKNYNWVNTKIKDPLQSKVEASFTDYVIALGLPPNFVKHARFAFGFHRLLKWVMADYENRAKYCKSGWKSWQKWSQVSKEKLEGRADKDIYCLKCGRLIKKNEDAIVLKYVTNKTCMIYLHKGCG